MTKRVLYTASTDIHLINFHLPYIQWFKVQGYEVHVACNGDRIIEGADKQFKVNINRSPLNKENVVAYQQLKDIIDSNSYELVHCHTPTCGVLTRLAARRARRNGTKVLYTAHGFHFYNGANIRNWLLFYPVEILLSLLSDAVITMNEEDFARLETSVFQVKGKHHIDGIGVNPGRLEYHQTELAKIRNDFNIGQKNVVFLYIAEFIERKNHKFIFSCLEEICKNNRNIKFLFAGGFASEKVRLEELSMEKGFSKNVHFLGYREDIGKFIALSDVGVSSSLAEGLPIGVLELMHNGKPVIASKIRGHKEIIEDDKNGYLFKLNDRRRFIDAVTILAENSELRNQMGNFANKSIEKFRLKNAIKNMADIYSLYLNRHEE